MKYIEKEKAARILREEAAAHYPTAFHVGLYAAARAIDSIPAADVRPVVACCDCKHFQVNVSPSGYLPQGVPEWECRHWCRPTDPIDFCSYGEKREES